MVKTLKIKNFKSIKELSLDCKKVNIFLGEPNAGKSNIIEALSIFSIQQNQQLKDFIRFRDLTDLFYDNQTDERVTISCDSLSVGISFSQHNANMNFIFIKATQKLLDFLQPVHGQNAFQHAMKFPFKFYKFNSQIEPRNLTPGSLNVPFGDNLVSILVSNASFKKAVSDIFRSKGFRLNIKPVERDLMISKEKGDDIYSYSYTNISETLRRVVFFMACLETNRNTTLLFDEPEANTFPFYTKYLAERIALDATNQYFFTTHNPYLLRSVIEKTPVSELQVVIAYMENYETKTRVLNENELSEIFDMDVFLNLDYFLNETKS